jgi:hypothetical protein
LCGTLCLLGPRRTGGTERSQVRIIYLHTFLLAGRHAPLNSVSTPGALFLAPESILTSRLCPYVMPKQWLLQGTIPSLVPRSLVCLEWRNLQWNTKHEAET